MKNGDRLFAIFTASGLALIVACIWWLWFEEATWGFFGGPLDTRNERTRGDLLNNARDLEWDQARKPGILRHLEDDVDLTDMQFAQLLEKATGEGPGPPFRKGYDGLGRVWDRWRQSLHFMAFTTVRDGVKMRYLRMWSVGRNGKNEKGSGDDISVEIPFLESIPFDPWRLGSQFKSADEESVEHRRRAELCRSALGYANGL